MILEHLFDIIEAKTNRGSETMEQTVYPLEMISVCSREGNLQPIRFRYETADQSLCTAYITEIIRERPTRYGGTEAIVYVCRTRIGNYERILELKYTVGTHRWSMPRTAG